MAARLAVTAQPRLAAAMPPKRREDFTAMAAAVAMDLVVGSTLVCGEVLGWRSVDLWWMRIVCNAVPTVRLK